MITRELENFLKSLPSFLTMAASAQNPLCIRTGDATTLETVAKAIWFVLPFHFLSFVGLVPLHDGDVTIVLISGFISLLGLMWIGSLLGSLTWLLGIGACNDRDYQICGWVVALTTCWFYCVVFLSGLNFYFWLSGATGEYAWPDLFRSVEKLLVNTWLQDMQLVVVSSVVPALASFLLVLTFGDKGRGSFVQNTFIAIVCWFATCAFIFGCGRFLAPVTRIVEHF